MTRTNLKDGKIDVLAEQWEGMKLNAPCDLAVSKSDHIYFTDPAFGNQQRPSRVGLLRRVSCAAEGPLKLWRRHSRPHGVAVSPNGRLLYVTNADERNVRVYDIDHNGDASGERVLIARTDGIPGGLKVGEKGDLYHRDRPGDRDLQS